MPEEAYEPPFNPSDSYSDTSTTTTHPPLHHNRRQATTRKRRSFCFCDDPDCGCRADHSICCHNDNTYSTLLLHPPLPAALFTDTDIRITCLPTYMNTILTLTDLWQHDNDNDYHAASSTTKTGQTATTTCSTAAAAAATTTLPRTQPSWWTTSSFRAHLPPQLTGSADGSVGSIKGESAHKILLRSMFAIQLTPTLPPRYPAGEAAHHHGHNGGLPRKQRPKLVHESTNTHRTHL